MVILPRKSALRAAAIALPEPASQFGASFDEPSRSRTDLQLFVPAHALPARKILLVPARTHGLRLRPQFSSAFIAALQKERVIASLAGGCNRKLRVVLIKSDGSQDVGVILSGTIQVQRGLRVGKPGDEVEATQESQATKTGSRPRCTGERGFSGWYCACQRPASDRGNRSRSWRCSGRFRLLGMAKSPSTLLMPDAAGSTAAEMTSINEAKQIHTSMPS